MYFFFTNLAVRQLLTFSKTIPWFTYVILLEVTFPVKQEVKDKSDYFKSLTASKKQQRVFSSYCFKGNAYSRQIQFHWVQAEDREGDRYAIHTRQQLIVMERYLWTVKYTAAVCTCSFRLWMIPFHFNGSNPDTGQTSNSIRNFFNLAESCMCG